jgi:hypothetical protein
VLLVAGGWLLHRRGVRQVRRPVAGAAGSAGP